MGSDDGEVNESPVHQQCFYYPFWIDQTEVTQVDFLRFNVNRGDENTFIGAFLPVNTIRLTDAATFCSVRGARLPTEPEWEYVARGPDSLIYPWGNEWNPDVVVYGGNSNYQPAAVGSYPAGASWVGALDMSGNVSELVSSLDLPYPYSAAASEQNSNGRDVNVIRGSNFSNTLPANHRASIRTRADWTLDFSRVGFRCVRSYAG